MCMPLLCKCAKYFFCLYMFVYTPLLNMFHLLVLLAISMFVCLVANKVYLRNEFHFSGVHGAMNRSGSRAK